MSVCVNKVSLTTNPCITKGVPHIFEQDLLVNVNITKSDVVIQFGFLIKTGFKCDGASVPWAFSWFLPSWAKEGCGFDDGVYNIGSCIHDGLYIHKGFGIFSREECDDILRGIWRCAGISRIKAGVADKCIEWFAGGEKHWGSDSFGVGNLFCMDF